MLEKITLPCPKCGQMTELTVRFIEVTHEDRGLSAEIKASVYTHNCKETWDG